MARYGGQFDAEAKRPGQFDAELNRGGQFDRDLIDTGTPDYYEGWQGLGFARAALTVALSVGLSAAALCSNLQRQNDEIVSAGVTPQLEEEYWRNPTPPVQASLLWPQPWTFDQQEPAGSLRGQPDEDFWVSGVAPVKASLAWPQQWTFDVQEPAGSLFGVPEEEAGLLRAAPPLPLAPVIPFTFTDDIVPQPGGTAPPDEDFWTSGVAPLRSALAWPQPWTFDVQEPAGSLYGVPEEDAWFPYRGSLLVAAPVIPKIDTDDAPQQPTTLAPDEDFWVSGVAPVQASLLWPQPAAFDVQEVVQAPIALPPDEDFWRSGVAPALATLVWPQQWTFDAQEPAGSLRGTAEEDYWTSGVAPQPARLAWPQAWAFDIQEAVQAPIALPPDEDFWRSGVAPLGATLAWPQPWTFDIQETVQPPIQDEDFWRSGVAPVAATLAWPRPWTFDVQEPGNLRGQPDEDFWRSWVAPVPAALIWPQPWSFETPDPGNLFTLFQVVSRPGREAFRDTLESGRPCLSKLNPNAPNLTALNPGDPNEPPT